MSTLVYKATPKAIQAGALDESDRLVFLGDGSAMRFQGDRLVQSDLVYRQPDSHVVASGETVPASLRASKQEIDHVKRHGIHLPCTLICV